jgi:hypothetical protein
MLSVAEKKTTEEQKLCEESDGSDAAVVDESEEVSDSSESEDGEAEDSTDDSKTHCLSNDKRLVLLTDMGLLVKTALNGEQTVFVMSFRTGLPVADAQVSLLGKNGVALSAGKTDSQGKVNFPTTDGLTAEKTPTVYLAEKDGDLSFLPFKRDNRQLDVSRFDIDGLHDSADSLQAYLFSDRGIYRPGDTVKVGVMLRKRDWSALPAGLPLKLRIKDPENQEVWNHVATFGAEGVTEISWPSPSAGKTGKYQVELFVADKSEKSLGVTTVRVEEFQPDRLQVKTDILAAPAKGWIRPEAVKAKVTVRNIFGTAAAGNTAKVELMIHPWSGQIPGYDNYSFRRTLAENIPNMPQTLGDVTTNDQGEALFELPLASISEPVFEIAVAGEGFEKGAGRSVVNTTTALVSKQDYLLGYKADGSLDYLSKDTKRSLSLLAVGADFQPRQSETVSAEIYENRYVSTLVKRKDGLYQYQSVLRQELRDTQPVSLIKGTAEFSLPSVNAGDFYVLFKNNQGQELNRVNYTVAGDGNVTRNIERNAELKLRLNKKEYQPGETIDMQIVAPYHGAGLITVEQDGVITSQWFKTDTTATSQQISLPKTISGNAYVSVAFVRSLDSKEIYMSPLSYGVVPISISKQAYTQQLQLNAPKSVQSGQTINVNYSVTEPTKLVLYAVDEGILQFAHYSNPTPLEYFFRKRALQVTSHQILDLILPDFSLVQRLSDPGGDETGELMGKYKNPFARKHKPPMTFWSGFVDAQPGEHTVSIPVPEYFNGSIRVIAVAVNAGKMGVATAQTTATQDYVIQPQQPYVVAPGDEFDMGVLVANASASAKAQDVKVSVVAGDALELLSPNPQSLSLAPAKDGTVRFHAKVKEKLGPINVRYQVTDASGKTVGYNEEMSIRPSQPLLTTLQGGVLTIEQQKKGKVQALDLQRTVYDEQRKAELAVSITPAAYLRGIMEFLKSYPYGCTEQITSQAFPAAVLGANPELGLNGEDVEKLVQRSLHILQTRQKHDGSFGYWSVADAGNADYSMYATHFLLEAKEHGFNLPSNMLERAMQYADEYAQITPTTSPEAYDEARAYAFYLLARNGSNIAERLRAFEAELKARPVAGLEGLRYRAGFFLAAAYKLHHLDEDSDRLLSGFRKQWQTTGLLPQDMQNNPEMLSLYLYLIGKHMPEQIDSKDPKFGKYLLELAQDLVKQRMNSFRGSLALLGLGSLWERFDLDKQNSFSVFAGTPMAQLPLQGKTSKSALLSPTTRPLEIRGQGLWNLYYQLSESGYDRAAPTKEIAEKLTINRSLLNEKGDKIQQISLQDKLHIRIALHPDQEMKDVAVVLLVPGGFEIDLGETGLAERKSLPIADKPLWEPDYIDVQEDRVVMFGGFDGSEKYFEFRLKPLNTGVYKVPSVFAEGMYDAEIQYRGLADEIRVVE